MTKLEKNYFLTAENIDIASKTFASVCDELRMDRKESIKQRLAFEEALLSWQKTFGEEQQFELIVYTRFFTSYVALRCVNKNSVNPFVSASEDQFSKSLLSMLSTEPEYYYSKSANNVLFKLVKPSMNPMVQLGIIIAVSLAIGVAGLYLIPADIITNILAYFIEPTYSAFLGVLSCIAGPLIFLSVAWGIYGIGDVATFNKLGKSLMGRYVLCAVVASFVAVCVFPLFDLRLANSNTDYSQIFNILQVFLNMLPHNIIEPFETGNTMQIIVMAIVMGIALLYLGKRSSAIATAIDQLNSIINFTLSIIGKLVPIFVALVLINIVWSGKLAIVGQMWKLVIIALVSYLICCGILTLVAAASLKVKPLVLVMKVLPACVVAFSTASSAASFETLTLVCEKKLGIDESMTKFGVPLGIVASKVIIAIQYAFAALYIASLENIQISIGWIITAAIVSAITAVATAPIPGGASIAYALLFSQLGLPSGNIGVILALDMVLDFAMTGCNVFCIPMIFAPVANKFGLINKEVLNSAITASKE